MLLPRSDMLLPRSDMLLPQSDIVLSTCAVRGSRLEVMREIHIQDPRSGIWTGTGNDRGICQQRNAGGAACRDVGVDAAARGSRGAVTRSHTALFCGRRAVLDPGCLRRRERHPGHPAPAVGVPGRNGVLPS